jgi:hypothetical protein
LKHRRLACFWRVSSCIGRRRGLRTGWQGLADMLHRGDNHARTFLVFSRFCFFSRMNKFIGLGIRLLAQFSNSSESSKLQHWIGDDQKLKICFEAFGVMTLAADVSPEFFDIWEMTVVTREPGPTHLMGSLVRRQVCIARSSSEIHRPRFRRLTYSAARRSREDHQIPNTYILCIKYNIHRSICSRM